MEPLRLDALLAKEEPVYGVDAAPTPADDAVRSIVRIWSSITLSHAFLSRRDEAARGTLIPIAPVARLGRIATIDVTVELRGAGIAYSSVTPVRPEVDPLLICCGLTRAHDDTAGVEKIDYTRADTNHASSTLWGYAGGQLIKVVGCRGNPAWPLTAAGLGAMRFVIQGIVAEDPANAALPAAAYDAVAPPAAVGMTLTLGAWAPDVTTAEWDMQAAIQRIDSAKAADGVKEFAISGFDPRYTLNAPVVPLATFDPYANMKNATALTLAQHLEGAGDYNAIHLDSTEVHIENVDPVDQNEFAAWAIQAQMRDFTLSFVK